MTTVNDEIKTLNAQLAEIEKAIEKKTSDGGKAGLSEKLKTEVKEYIKRISGGMVKVIKSSGGLLIVKDGRVILKDKIAPFAFTAENAEAVLSEQFKRIDFCISYITENGAIPRYIAEIGKSLNTVYALFDNAEKLENELKKADKYYGATKAELEKKKKEIAQKIEKLQSEIKKTDEAFKLKKSNFAFGGTAMPERYSNDVVLDLGLSEKTKNFLHWYTSEGILVVNPKKEKRENINAFLRALIVKFLYSFPKAEAKLLYCCRNIDDEANIFLTGMKNKIGEEFFFDKVKYFGGGGDKYSSDITEVIARLYKLCSEDRTALLSESYENSISDYNMSNPDNAQSPLLVVLQDYPAGFENCLKLDYLFHYGKKYGVYFVVVNGEDGVQKNAYSYENDADAGKYANLSVDFESGRIKNGAYEYQPLNIEEKKLAELFEPLKKIKEKSRGAVSYDDVGFGNERAEGAEVTNEISIPIGKSEDKIYTMDFAVSGKDSKPVSYIIIGKPGCGKSSVIDSLIINGSMKYSPDDLNFYLIDFKDGVSSAPYIGNAKMPHIKLVAQKSKQEEAEIILKTVLKEKERRNAVFVKHDCRDLVAYNKKADLTGGRHLPRIIVVIDEFHAIFKDDGDADRSQRLSGYCKQIVQEARSAGIHLLITSQNADRKLMTCVGDFMSGRICFEVTSIEHAEALLNRENSLKAVRECTGQRGVAMISCDSGATVRKLRASFHMGNQNEYAEKVRKRWKDFAIDTAVVGDDSALNFGDVKNKREVFSELSYGAPFGLSYYDHKTVYLPFDRMHSTLGIFGDDDAIQTDHLISVMLYAVKRNAKIQLVDESDSLTLAKAFENCANVEQYSGKEYLDMLSKANAELKRRIENRRQTFEPYFVIIHSLHMITAFTEDRRGGGGDGAPSDGGYRSLRAMREAPSENTSVEGQTTFLKMLKDASLVNNFFICFSIKPDEFPRRGTGISDVKLKILHSAFVPAMENIAEKLYNHKKLGMTCNENISLYSENGQPLEKVRYYRYGDDAKAVKIIRSLLKDEN